jgi:hypothetical protein
VLRRDQWSGSRGRNIVAPVAGEPGTLVTPGGSPGPRRGGRTALVLALRCVTIGSALTLAALTLEQRGDDRSAREALRQHWQDTGTAARQPTAASRSQRDPDHAAARLALGRVLLMEGFQAGAIADLPPAEAAAAARRSEAALALAAHEASAVLAERPTSWEAAMVLGGTRMIEAWRAGGDEFYRKPERWRDPLEHSRALAPGAAEPGRLLAHGYLSSWHALDDAQRAAGRALLQEGFSDPRTLSQLLPAWAAVARDPEELASILPPGPQPYELLQQAYRGYGDWQRFCEARDRWLPLLARGLEEKVAEGEHRLALGDRAGGAQTLLAAAAAAPPDRRFAALFSRAMRKLPAGPIPPAQANALAGWLRWALPLWQLGQEPLPRDVFGRVAGLSAALPPERAALAALAAGDLERAEVWERRSERLWSEDWAPYAVAKAEVLLDRRQVAEAAAALGEVHRSYQRRWPYLRASSRLAAARGEEQPAADQAGPATSWPATAWVFDAGEGLLEVVPSGAATGLELVVDAAPAAGSAVEVTLDGLSLGCFPARQGEVLRVTVPLPAAPHYLTFRQLAGERVAPGAVRLATAPGAP